MVGRRVPPEVTFSDSFSYVASVQKAFQDEPAKYDEFIKLLNDYSTYRVDAASTIARVEELMKDHRKLFLGFNVFLPAGAKITIPPETNRTIAPEAKTTTPPEAKITIPPEAVVHHGAESSYNKRKRAEADGANFMKKLKTRFQSIDTHVVESFQEIMIKFQKGKMSEKEVREEVVDLLYYHEDLIEDFSRLLSKE